MILPEAASLSCARLFSDFIGCGWGGLVCYAAEKYGVKAHGITLSNAELRSPDQRCRKTSEE